jgi:hypothetical protein
VKNDLKCNAFKPRLRKAQKLGVSPLVKNCNLLNGDFNNRVERFTYRIERIILFKKILILY